MWTHAKPLVVRANFVRRTLVWLKANNHLYASININNDVLDEIEHIGGLPYNIEFQPEEHLSTTTVSGHAPEQNRLLVVDIISKTSQYFWAFLAF
jgi:hypothetical protein